MMLTRSFAYFLLALLLGVGLAACNGNGADDVDDMDFRGADVAEVTIQPVGNEMRFQQEEFTVSPGQTVQITMDNIADSPAMVHNVLVIDSNEDDVANEVNQAAQDAGSDADYIPEHDAVIASTPQADPGEVTEIEFTAPDEPGDYRYFCTYPGHFSTMQGVMTVAE